MTGQPGQSGQDRPGQDRDAAGDDESRSGGNWHKAVDEGDAGPGLSTAPGRNATPGRDGAPGRDAVSGRDGVPGRGAAAGRGAGEAPEDRRPRPPRTPPVDLTGDIQRWLIRSGARSMRRELGEQFRRAWSGQRAEPTEPGDVWNTATTEPPPELSEAPECAWCPVCRAARRIRESGPGLGGQLAGAGDAVAAAVQEAMTAFDAVLSARPRTETAGRPARPDPADAPQAPTAAGSAAGPTADAPPEAPTAAGSAAGPTADAPPEAPTASGSAAGPTAEAPPEETVADAPPAGPTGGPPPEGPDREPDDRD